MAKSKNLNGILIAGAIILAAIILLPYIKNLSSDTTYVINNELIDRLNNQQQGSCSLSTTTPSITKGDLLSGTITASPNTLCEVYGMMVGDNRWIQVGEGTTNGLGSLSYSDNFNIVGSFLFKAVCGSCITNEVSVTVRDTSSTCTDSDGDNPNSVGWVDYNGDRFYDKCLDIGNGVTEYICQNGVATPKNWACDYGEKCLQTRSGGYCVKDTPTWNVGDVVYDSGYVGGDLLAGNPGFSTLINLGDLPPTSELGGCKLQARIQTDWGYITPSTCSGLQGMEGMYFSFYDSSGKVWERTDTQPTALGSLTNCGLSWDGQNPWSFNYNKLLNLPSCSVGLDYKVEVVVCDC